MSNPFANWSQEDVRRHQAKVQAVKNKSHDNHNQPSSPIAKQAVRNGPLATQAGEGGDATRYQVSVVSYRRKLLDPDNLTGGCKYFIDGLRYAGLIPDDAPDKITLTVSQEKVKADERTEITITKVTK